MNGSPAWGWFGRVAMPLVLGWALFCAVRPAAAAGAFRAGAAVVDVSPVKFPVLLNGGFLPQVATNVHDPLHARFLVLDDGSHRVGICVLDTCLFAREFADEARGLMAAASGISMEKILFSATHTHTAPSIMECHGTPADTDYQQFLLPRLAEGMREAVRRLEPARVAWGVTQAWDRTFCRRWVRRPDRVELDPFGSRSVRVNMNPGHLSPDVISPAGPKEPDLSFLAVQRRDGTPLAILANFGNHYFGNDGVGASADYFGVFARRVGERLGASGDRFVGIMSQGTSGDQNRINFASPPDRTLTLEAYADDLAAKVAAVYRSLVWHEWVPVEMRDQDLAMHTRGPSAARLEWARGLVAGLQGRAPHTLPEIYAKEQIWLHEHPVRQAKIQALRIGELGIAAASAEVYAITGLKLKAQSPFPTTFWITLANGEDGYVPTPEHHALGGYTTWATRTAALEVDAEPRFLEGLLGLFEELSGRSRRGFQPAALARNAYARTVLASHPAAYWPFADFAPPVIRDLSGHHRDAAASTGVLFQLPGVEPFVGLNNLQPPLPNPFSGDWVNRAVQFAGGRVSATVPLPPSGYAVEFWFWNGLSNQVRSVTGELAGVPGVWTLALAGTNGIPGTLVLAGESEATAPAVGRTPIPPRAWHHVVVNVTPQQVQVFLDGRSDPEVQRRAAPAGSTAGGSPALWFGGRAPGGMNLEGRVDEAAVYGRPLRVVEIGHHYRQGAISGGSPARRAQEGEL